MGITLRRILKSTKLSSLGQQDLKSCSNNAMRSLIGLVFFTLSFFLCTNVFAQCTLACNNGIQLSLDGNGEALVDLDLVMPQTGCNPANFAIQVIDANGNNIPSLLTCAVVGTTVDFSVTEIATSNSCWGTITVSDYLNPVINCMDLTVLCVSSTDPNIVGYPTVDDNCAILTNTDLSYTDNFIDLACFSSNGTDEITSKIERTWTVQDDFGNADTCLQTIFLKRATTTDIDFPTNLDDLANPTLDCGDDPTDLSLTGQPTINGEIIDNAGNCELAVSYSDQETALCGLESKRIIRTWTAIDWCTNITATHIQIIELEDTTAPTINCPADINTGTSANACSASIFLPTATATDDCSGITITPSWVYGTGQGPFFDVAVGTHIVTYTATDDCGNSATCTMTVTVVDNTSPVMICKQGVDINLGSSGNASVNATTFDDGSYDNCGIDRYEVSRDGVNYAPFVNLDCADIPNSPVMVYIRIFDVAGNYNLCSTAVDVNDNINPAILCPSDVTINCVDDYTDLITTGEPIAADNCTIDTLYFSDQLNLNSCSVGTINRTWTVEDVFGNESSCIQNITVQDNTPVSVIFPSEYTTYECGALTTPTITGEPTVTGDDCESVGISHTDNVFNIAPPACYKILRNWVVVDWCTFDPNSGSNAGYWTYTQIINVLDNEAPTISCPQDITVGITSSSCGSAYISFETATATDCNPNVTITNDSPFADANGEDASGTYPIGTHVVNFTATDGCGNESTCQTTVTVEDATPPTPVCVSGIALSLSANGTITIPASLIDHGSYDNCTDAANLIIELIPNTFTCADIGQQAVNLHVTDENGNTDFCTAIVTIQDNTGNCPDLTSTVAGFVITAGGEPLKDVTMELKGTSTMSADTDLGGDYEIGEVPMGDTYTLTPDRDFGIRNGVSTVDVLLTQRHVLGILPFNSPYKIIAADVNKSKSITGIDIVLMRKVILYINDSFPNNESWRFIDADYNFPYPQFPFEEEFPEGETIENLQSDISNADYIAVKSGDVNLSARSENLISNIRSFTDQVTFQVKDQHLIAGEEYEIDFKLLGEKEVVGFQFTLDFDENQLEFIDIVEKEEVIAQKEHFGLSHTQKGFITSSWTNISENSKDKEIFFTIKFKAKSNSSLRELLKISSRFTAAEAYDQDINIMDVKLDFENQHQENIISTDVELFQNSPNPFVSKTTIKFQLQESTTATLSIIDMSGKVVHVIQKDFGKGQNKLHIDRRELALNSGVYIYQLTSVDGQVFTKKMVVQ